MVEIKFDPNSPYRIDIIRNWKDNLEQIYSISIFLLVFLIFSILAWIKRYPSDLALLLWDVIFLGILLWFILPIKHLRIDLDKNQWKIQLKIIFMIIPLSSEKISDLSFILVEDITEDNRDTNKKLTLNSLKYHSSLQLLGFSKKEGESKDFREKWIFSKRNTSNFRVHLREIRENTRIAQTLVEIFQGLDIPIELILKRKVYQNGELISQN
ncbi:MAG: hypothetical protein K9W44_11590 [Candidatus Lokiarchaeota archaeon]|nr:hypothetical protein [Candidatus Harpocratesius repetitus]